MSRVIIACANGTGRSHTVVERPAHEASLRDLPLEVRYGSPPNDLRTTAMLVLDLSAAGDDTTGLATGQAAFAVTAASACAVVLIPDVVVPVAAPARRVTQVAPGNDARHPAEGAIDFAFGAAQGRGIQLHALHAWELPSCAAGLPFGVPEDNRGTWEDHEVQLLTDALRPWPVK
ncbi:hypothetical protein [Streptomyces sp. NPDC001480]|uniref:hypothetical protein n=1 Tax=Streptomyces sp. NPDC001480 TaxID=3364577 RepID=UPI0036945DA9